jgi:hypothetical protein
MNLHLPSLPPVDPLDQISYTCIEGVPGGKLNILGGHSIGHSKQETVYVHVSYCDRFPR